MFPNRLAISTLDGLTSLPGSRYAKLSTIRRRLRNTPPEKNCFLTCVRSLTLVSLTLTIALIRGNLPNPEISSLSKMIYNLLIVYYSLGIGLSASALLSPTSKQVNELKLKIKKTKDKAKLQLQFKLFTSNLVSVAYNLGTQLLDNFFGSLDIKTTSVNMFIIARLFGGFFGLNITIINEILLEITSIDIKYKILNLCIINAVIQCIYFIIEDNSAKNRTD